ncbi:ribosomal 40S subunit protein S13 [Turnera subulata]|uniref:Ribosomal 40S subunit protein S13 n=1 Tax=Turnera subulata TaxID=218843 RepID=A0A9Q0GJU5_9ROSI|nr:ribosomal 40S subunit protein S13 [Turnera subulata]
MGRMHSRGKGISASALPYKRTPPSWLKVSSQDVEENICKFAKKGLTPSQIGVILRDSHGIAQVKSVTGSKILRILKAHGLAPEIPEDLYHLIKKAVAIRKHLERNRKDKDSKFRLILVESRIHRLARYYKKTKKLPPVWKYESTTASTLNFNLGNLSRVTYDPQAKDCAAIFISSGLSLVCFGQNRLQQRLMQNRVLAHFTLSMFEVTVKVSEPLRIGCVWPRGDESEVKNKFDYERLHATTVA